MTLAHRCKSAAAEVSKARREFSPLVSRLHMLWALLLVALLAFWDPME